MVKKAFTLAEIMIVLTVIGVLTAILLPVAFQSSPDENVMKFKKANATFGAVISELIHNDKYYANGDLGLMPNGAVVTSPTYLCETMADVMTIKSVNCSSYNGGQYYIDMDRTYGWGAGHSQVDLDNICLDTNAGAEIVTPDNITYYQVGPASHFGSIMDDGRRFFSPVGGPVTHYDVDGFDRIYKVLCVDVDGIGKGEAPFGYGVRADGKILPGPKAQEWIKKSIQKGKD